MIEIKPGLILSNAHIDILNILSDVKSSSFSTTKNPMLDRNFDYHNTLHLICLTLENENLIYRIMEDTEIAYWSITEEGLKIVEKLKENKNG